MQCYCGSVKKWRRRRKEYDSMGFRIRRCRICHRIVSKPRVPLPHMKEPPMLSAEQLSLTPNQYEVAKAVLAKFESGTLEDLPVEHGPMCFPRPRDQENDLKFFNYSAVLRAYECGSAGCIFGWLRALDPLRTYTASGHVENDGDFEGNFDYHIPEQLYVLCFDNHATIKSVEDAAKALRQYLETGRGGYYARQD